MFADKYLLLLRRPPICVDSSGLLCRFRKRVFIVMSSNAPQDNSAIKSYADWLIDQPVPAAIVTKSEAAKHLIKCFRYRLELKFCQNQPNRFRGSKNDGSKVTRTASKSSGSPASLSHYDSLLFLLEQFDASAVAEIFRLLLERRCALPLLLTGDQHLIPILDHVMHTLQDGKLRVCIVSCRNPEESCTSQLLYDVFHVDSLHRQDSLNGNRSGQKVGLEIGSGCFFDADGLESVARECLVLHVVGDFSSIWPLIQQFSDYLLVEDSTEKNKRFYRFKDSVGLDGLDKIAQITVWRPTAGEISFEDVEVATDNYGFEHVIYHAPLSQQLHKMLTEDVIYVMDQSLISSRQKKCLEFIQPLQKWVGISCSFESLNFIIDEEFEDLQKEDKLLQNLYRREAEREEIIAQNKNDERIQKKETDLIEQLRNQRKVAAREIARLPLISCFLELLRFPDPSTRVLGVLQLERFLLERNQLIIEPADQKWKQLKAARDELENKLGESNPMTVAANERASEAHRDIIATPVVTVAHIWRELSHLYIARPAIHHEIPRMAAQHLLDGLCLELLDGDSNRINQQWISDTLYELEQLMGDRQRIFVLSVMGVQSSGKSTLLNLMFGTQLKTSVGRCTRGINMQLVAVADCQHYDYIILLDTEGTRAPELWGSADINKRDNQMATLSILLADATIIVNAGENDAAVKDILPLVLMAYQDSKMAEDNGGQLSSSIFFVYNRIDTREKSKLDAILRRLDECLKEAFKTVQNFGRPDSVAGPSEHTSDGLFRSFKLDSSDSSDSDVLILGNIKKSFIPPDDVPDPSYGQALQKFREHIHRKVTASAGWKNRTVAGLWQYIEAVNFCIRSANFTLNFPSIVERLAYDQLDTEYRSYTRLLVDHYDQNFSQVSRMISRVKLGSRPVEEAKVETFEKLLLSGVKVAEMEIDERVEEMLQDPRRSTWQLTYQHRWIQFKLETRDHWIQLVRDVFESQLKLDYHVESYKKQIRQQIRQNFTANPKQVITDPDFGIFDQIYLTILADAKAKHPLMDVGKKIDSVYCTSLLIQSQNVNVNASISRQSMPSQIGSALSNENPSNWSDFITAARKTFRRRSVRQSSLDAIKNFVLHLEKSVVMYLSGKQRYSDHIVEEIIEITQNAITQLGIYSYSVKQLAHRYTKTIASDLLMDIQENWETNNSVVGLLEEESTVTELKDFFQAASQGAQSTQLFICLMTNSLQTNIIEAFRQEMVQTVHTRLQNQQWLINPNVLQDYHDLHLIGLLCTGKIKKVLQLINNPESLYKQVLEDLIAKQIPDLQKEWKDWTARLAAIIQSAAAETLTAKNGRAKTFADQLLIGCCRQKNDMFLADKLTTDTDGYGDCDQEDGNFFRDQCLNLVNVVQQANLYNLSQTKLIDLVVTYMRNLRLEDVARPRCNAFCPLCQSMCIHPANHDVKQLKHEAYHQPQGLTGWRWKCHSKPGKIGTLVSETCNDGSHGFYYGNVLHQFNDYQTLFPDWMQPSLLQRLECREYIMATYNNKIAKHYQIKACPDIPTDYFRKLKNIRALIKRRNK